MLRRRMLIALMLSACILLPVRGAQASRQATHTHASVVTLRFATYGFDPWSKIFPQMAARFQKEHPTIKLQVIVTTWNTLYTKMQAEAMAHQGEAQRYHACMGMVGLPARLG